jgi:alkaline phosphatase D
MAKWLFACIPILAACRPVSLPLVERGGWVLVEERGSAAFVWTLSSAEEGSEPVEARSWVTFRAGVGEIGVAEVNVIDPEPGRLYRRFRWGKLLDLFILDTRQYRSDNREPDGLGKTMLGPVQRRWLVDGVTGSGAVWKAIVSSVPLSVPTGRSARDSWSGASVRGVPEENPTGFSVERDAILRMLRTQNVKNLIWITADVHHAELIRHRPWPDFSFYEFIAGPLSASRGRPRTLDAMLNPQSLFGMGDADNFGEVSIDSGGLTVRIFDAHGALRAEHRIAPD